MENFKNINDILTYRKSLETEKEHYKMILDGNRFNRDHAISKSQKKYFSCIVVDQKQEIHRLKTEIALCDAIIKQTSTFPSHIILTFLAQCISHFEKTEYVFDSFLVRINMGVDRSFAYPNYLNYFAIYEKQYASAKHDLEETYGPLVFNAFYQNHLLGENCLMDIYTNEITLLKDGTLNSLFAKFPYLEQVAFDLINRRLSEPEKPLEMILDDELESLKETGVPLKKAYES